MGQAAFLEEVVKTRPFSCLSGVFSRLLASRPRPFPEQNDDGTSRISVRRSGNANIVARAVVARVIPYWLVMREPNEL